MVGIRWAVRGMGVISTLILARLLVPEDFGLVALAVSYAAIVEGFTEMPMGQALIRFRDAGRSMYDSAWTLTVVRGLAIAILMIASASLVSRLVDEPRLELLIHILALSPILGGFTNPRFIDFQKNLSFSQPAILQVSSKLLQVVVTVLAALTLRNYWSLVIGNLVFSAMHLIMSYVLIPYRPSLTLVDIRQLFGFSGWLTASSIIRTLNTHADKFVISALLGTKLTGYYHIGKELCTLPNQQVIAPLNYALYPALTIVGENRSKIQLNLFDAIAAVSALSIPLGLFFALIAEEFVLLLLGKKWLPIVPIIQIIVPLLSAVQLTAFLDAFLMATSRTRLLFYISCIQTTLRLGLMIPGVIYFGFMGGIYAWALMLIAYFLVRLYYLGQETDSFFFKPLIVTWRSWISATAMVCAVIAIEQTLTFQADDPSTLIIVIIVKFIAAILTYFIAHGGLWIIAGKPSGIESKLYTLLTIRPRV